MRTQGQAVTTAMTTTVAITPATSKASAAHHERRTRYALTAAITARAPQVRQNAPYLGSGIFQRRQHPNGQGDWCTPDTYPAHDRGARSRLPRLYRRSVTKLKWTTP